MAVILILLIIIILFFEIFIPINPNPKTYYPYYLYEIKFITDFVILCFVIALVYVTIKYFTLQYKIMKGEYNDGKTKRA